MKNQLNRTFNREFIGYSAGKNKHVNLVVKANNKMNHNLKQVALFHPDRVKEFDNKLIDEVLKTLEIEKILQLQEHR
ncbi:hypothetical protein [Dolosicoccus paucivorans]|uniref:Uncharacterized protein n=1 Tax=Dolosicoccus paucivorans TaxID=84521 RepID=A0A2N6SKY5_9LACT|nr:hypothetical protein [Dolosicoccus paucivorans]PMB83601.1 hypothetical protein CJ206_08290 [Dolosicoccus paucivorans]PMC57179.1 hypothetical protein CJ205_08150 [Dolosicoccus paucivorans]